MSADIILGGGGLASSLAALALRAAQPGARILILDRAGGPSNSHTWSFHGPDISPDWHARLAPALIGDWSEQEVHFPGHSRRLRAGYSSMGSEGLARLVAEAGIETRWNAEIARLDEDRATLADGEVLTALCILDGRGAKRGPHLVTGFQKFVGIEIECDAPHGIARPVIMDATVPQEDGYRFIYVLPFTERRVLIEDTRYSDGATLSDNELAAEALDYAAARGWHGREVRRERGVLPIALAHDAAGFWRDHDSGPVPIGLRAGLFHPVTGYSLPVAAEVADLIAGTQPLTTAAIRTRLRAFALRRAREDRFLRLLNRMLFRGCPGPQRYRLLERFYRLPEPLIERFYAGRLTWADRLRIVTGKPPIPISAALPCLPEKPLLKGET
ncbi:lycopene beta-cyclase CrtY [Paracoccus tibetensis]|uniref:Lycopene beta-cyclase n=1 Tax=Paracoccus tibetensis TaxID=336292 RepID=A0A1G5HZJ3_9RHOB|nr:lycopene beta-cyclase CrtY [Paracoccus tibetensis]SCY69223.1 lycopene beta-cyclase [Paracoccus tibetensis]